MSTSVPPVEKDPKTLGNVLLLNIAHFFNDASSSFLSPILPLLVSKLQLSLTLAASLASLYSLTGSFLQLISGLISDHVPGRYFIIGGPLIAILFMSLLGVVPSYYLAALCVLLAGVGSAMFHPQAVSAAGNLMTGRRGLAISIFIFGGNLGMAVGPLYIISVVSLFGFERSFLAAIPGLLTVLFLWFSFPKEHRGTTGKQVAKIMEAFLPQWKSLTLLSLLVILRSLVQQGMSTFLPLLLTSQGGSLFTGGLALTVFSLTGAIGSFCGGISSDRWGRRNIIILSSFCVAPFLFGFFQTTGGLALLFLALVGLTVKATNPVVVAFAQELMPGRAGTASSLVMGFSWGIAGIAITGLGKLADVIGLERAMEILMILPLIAVVVAWFLPSTSNALDKS